MSMSPVRFFKEFVSTFEGGEVVQGADFSTCDLAALLEVISGEREATMEDHDRALRLFRSFEPLHGLCWRLARLMVDAGPDQSPTGAVRCCAELGRLLKTKDLRTATRAMEPTDVATVYRIATKWVRRLAGRKN